MPVLPSSQNSLLVRTDFTDDAAWERAYAAVLLENSDGFRAYVQVIDERVWEGAAWEEVREPALAAPEHAAVLFIVDHQALANEHAVVVIDLSGEARSPFRCIAQELWSVDNNLNLANMGWEEFAEAADADGVFRGFQ
jgi:hypothetical protein